MVQVAACRCERQDVVGRFAGLEDEENELGRPGLRQEVGCQEPTPLRRFPRRFPRLFSRRFLCRHADYGQYALQTQGFACQGQESVEEKKTQNEEW